MMTSAGKRRPIFAAIAIGLALAGAGGAYLISTRKNGGVSQEVMSTAGASTEEGVADSSRSDQSARKPLYYQHPDGKPAYSATPRKTDDGRDFVPVFEDKPSPGTAREAAQKDVPSDGKGRILYYRNPMGLPDTSPVPKKDAMGMDYIPVYEEDVDAAPGIVQLKPERVQILGVRTAPVEMRVLSRMIRVTARASLNERRLAVVTTRIGGWAEKLHVSAAGDTVKNGQPLFDLYSPDLVTAEQEYLVAAALNRAQGGELGRQGTSSLAEASLQRLRALGVPDNEIARLRRTGKISRSIPILSPTDGTVIEKDVVEGMRIESDMPLYKIADLSTLWLIGEIQEQDLGLVKPAQTARATFVALPGRTFEGTVDFVYPTLAPDTRTGRIRIIVPNDDLTLRPDMFATVTIDAPATGEAKPVPTVPDSAVIDSGTRQVALVLRGQGRYEPRNVRVGAQGEGFVEILEGVTVGEAVVVGANFLIDSESNLRAALQSLAPPSETPRENGDPQ